MNSSTTAYVRLAEQARSRIQEVTPREVVRVRPLPVIIDVREAEEYAQGHIAGALHLSRGVLEQKVGDVASDSSTSILVYCARGDRAALAADSLTRMGYQNVCSLKGGLQSWLEAGGVVELPSRRQNLRRRIPSRNTVAP